MSGQVVPFPEKRSAGETWEPWVDEATLSRHYGVSSRTIRRWRREGMPSSRFEGARRFKVSETERWHEGRKIA